MVSAIKKDTEYWKSFTQNHISLIFVRSVQMAWCKNDIYVEKRRMSRHLGGIVCGEIFEKEGML